MLSVGYAALHRRLLYFTALRLRNFGDFIKGEHAGSPLRDRKNRTNGQIDALVYALYGLTEAKIGIVEGGE